jgi:NAD(P)-dependent dehydrogenase (short-subunit alcohol dehydrogenase family)
VTFASLEGRTALVTGASRGIGRAIAIELAAGGAAVVIGYRTGKDEADALAAELGGRAVQADVSSAEDAARLVAEAGDVDILVNNAGIESEGIPIEEVADEVWNKIIDTNLSSMFKVARAVGTRMIARGQGGAIINVSSLSGLIISKIFPRHNVVYGVSKAGVAHLTRGLASEWAQYGIRVNALAPGYMLTANTEASRRFPEIVERLTEMTPLKRYGHPWELKGAVVFLASEASSYMTGSVVVIDGGNSIW